MSTPRKKATKKKALVVREPYNTEARVVAVTGAYSFIGAQIIAQLEQDKRYAKILALDVRKPTQPLAKTTFHKIDLTLPAADSDLAALFARERVDTLIHAAFLSAPTHNATWAHELESIGTMHVLNAAAEAKLRKLILWSQTVVYGAHPLNPNFLSEEHELRGTPASRFVMDKVEAEKQVKRFAKENPDIVVTTLRTAATLGPTIRNFATRFFSRPIAPTLMGFDPLMQFVHEADVIAAFKLVIDRDYAGAYNIVGEGVLPYSTVLAMMGRIPLPMPHFIAAPLSQALWATQVFDAPATFLDFLRFHCVADGDKAKNVIGFVAAYNIKATIYDFIGMLGVPVPASAQSAMPAQGQY